MPLNNPPLSNIPLCLWCNLLEVSKLSLYFTYNLMWYICVTFRPLKERWCPHHALCFLCLFCQSIVEFFYGFLGMFHVGLIHLRCLYGTVSFPLDQVLPLSPPYSPWLEHGLHFKFWFIINQVRRRPWVVLSIGPWGITGDRLLKQNMKYGMNLKIFR